jgi:ABC-type uncharacterized transport system ATPase subunit
LVKCGAVDSLHLTLDTREVVGFLVSNGAGTSTTLRLAPALAINHRSFVVFGSFWLHPNARVDAHLFGVHVTVGE